MHRIFFWFLLALLPTQLGVHFWPAWAMVLGRRVDYLSPTISLTDILLFLTVGTFLIFNLKFSIFRQFSKFKIEIFNKKSLVFIAAFIFLVLNVLLAESKPVAMYTWLKVAEFVGLGWYIVRTRPTLATIVTPLSVGVLYSSVLAVAQFILQRSVGGPLWWLGERTFDAATPGIARTVWYGRELLRSYATFPHPNVLGGFLASLLPLLVMSLMGLMGPMSQRKKLFCIITIVFGSMALLLTFSRSAMVVGAMAMVITLFMSHSRESGNPVFVLNWIRGLVPRMTMTVRLLFAFTIITLVFSSWFLVQSFGNESESVVVRQQLNAAAITLWQSSPLFGVGMGNFLVRLPEVLPSRTIYFLQPVHNVYLLLLVEAGVAGFLPFLWLLWRSFQNFKFQISNFKLSLLVFLLLGLVDHYPLTLQQGQVLLTVLVGMGVSMNKSDQSRPIRPMND